VLAVRAAGATRCGVSATEKIMEEAEKRYAEGTLCEAGADAKETDAKGAY
jgi:deoxyribose-phosphate aldolase